MKQLITFLFIYAIVSLSIVQGQTKTNTPRNFTLKEKMIINSEAQYTLQTYQSLMNELGNTLKTETDKVKILSESIIKMFISRNILVYNDLDPDHRMSEYYEIDGYVANMLLWYPDGLTINLDFDACMVSSVKQHQGSIYTLDVQIPKQMNGNFQNKKQNANVENLSFRLAFTVEKGKFANFKLVGISAAKTKSNADDQKLLEEVNNANVTRGESQAIQIQLRNLLNDYYRNLSLIGNPNEPAEDKDFYEPAFLEFFSDSTATLLDDLEPGKTENSLSPAAYIKKFRQSYPKGINNLFINIDSVKYGSVLKASNGGYYLYCYVNKNFSGKFNNKNLHRFAQLEVFKITFKKQGIAYTNFKISSIDNPSLNFYEGAKGNAVDTTYSAISTAKRKGLNVGIGAQYGMAKINNKNINQTSTESNGYKWTVTDKYSYVVAVEGALFKNNQMAIVSGLEYLKISSMFSLNGVFQESIYSQDKNGDPYNKMVEAINYDSLLTINMISIPIKILWVSGRSNQKGFYVEGGIKLSLLASSKYITTGSLLNKGYYENNPDALKIIQIPQLGYSSRNNINLSGKPTTKSLAYSVSFSFGYNHPLGYFSSIRIGPEIQLGLSDIEASSDYLDIFGNNLQKQKTVIQWLGLKVLINYKW